MDDWKNATDEELVTALRVFALMSGTVNDDAIKKIRQELTRRAVDGMYIHLMETLTCDADVRTLVAEAMETYKVPPDDEREDRKAQARKDLRLLKEPTLPDGGLSWSYADGHYARSLLDKYNVASIEQLVEWSGYDQ